MCFSFILINKTMLELLPLELIALIADYLDLRRKIALMNTCRTTRYLIYPQICKIASTVPIRVTVDFSRNNNHHINVHNVWIKIGWFSPKLVMSKEFDLAATLEFCDECLEHRLIPNGEIRGIYVLIKKIYDVNLLLALVNRKNSCYLDFQKTYFPRIGGFSKTGIECAANNIYIGHLTPLKDPNSKLIFGTNRTLILEYGNHRLYINMTGYQPLG